MRSRAWVWVTVMVILAMVAVGVGAVVLGGTSPNAEPQPVASETDGSAASGEGVFQLRQVLFQETGRIHKKPPLRPGPAEGGKNATRDLLRVDCGLKPRPMKDDDNVVLCDADEFRYGLGPSALPASPVASAEARPGAEGNWVVLVQLNDEATQDLAKFTQMLSSFGPPLNQAAIVINGVVVAAPAVSESISSGALQITGPLTQQDAEGLAVSLG